MKAQIRVSGRTGEEALYVRTFDEKISIARTAKRKSEKAARRQTRTCALGERGRARHAFLPVGPFQIGVACRVGGRGHAISLRKGRGNEVVHNILDKERYNRAEDRERRELVIRRGGYNTVRLGTETE